ncbi:MAG TPA: tetratricopeptide repeat protein, partial [Leptospiraceae bacterium]|nr:tetratricopeptide repeat protein [Leptospiraceae bacterium]
HTKHSNYQKAKEIYSKFIQHSESSTEILFLGSQLEKRIGNYEESIKIAERVKLRDPNHLKNLIHLADLYLFTNNKERARKIILKIKKIDPKHEKLKVLESKL